MNAIRSIETFLVPPRWLFVRVETSEGLIGWGEASLEGHGEAVVGAFASLQDRFVGADADRIEDIWQTAYRLGFYRGGPVLMSALSGLDQALWDIKGKALGVPVAQLLGGEVRDSIRVYSWIGGDDPASVKEEAEVRKAQGFDTVKMNATGALSRLDSRSALAGVVERVTLVREAGMDVAVDFHSGGKTLDFVPFTAAHILEDKGLQEACYAAMQAFNAPYSVQLLEIDSEGMYDTAVEDMGTVLVTTELGGGGMSTARSNAIAKKGLRNVLIHAGILQGEMQIDPTIRLDMPDDDCFVFSENDGLFEPMVDLGEPVSKGNVVARIWPVDRTGVDPIEYRAKISGLLISRHCPGLVKAGDCAAAIGFKVD